MTKNRKFLILGVNEKERNFLDKNKLIFQGIFYAIFHTLKIFLSRPCLLRGEKNYFWVNLSFNFFFQFIFLEISILGVHKFFILDSWNKYIQ